MVSNSKLVYCVEHDAPMLIESTDSNLFIGGTEVPIYQIPTEEDKQKAKEQIDTMLAFTAGVSMPTSVTRKNVKQAGVKTKAKNVNILPNAMEEFLKI